jgi:endonuclease YncB( thermonuclease family)
MPIRRPVVAHLAALAMLLCLPALAFADAVIGTKSGKVYHNHPKDCASARRIGDANLTRFASREEAETSGRRQCRVCAKLDQKNKAEPDATPPKPTKRGEPRPPENDPPPARNGVPVPPPVSTTSLPEMVRATKVIDAGTIELDTGDKVHLAGIVVPDRAQPLARSAQRFIVEQTRDRLLRATVSATACAPTGRDTLGRWCVSIVPTPDGRDLAGELLFQGYAWIDHTHSSPRSAEYDRLEEAAWRAGRGIWTPLEGAAGQREVIAGRGASAYHDDHCEHLPHLTNVIKMPVNEARARRLVPCGEYRAKGDERTAAAVNE